MHRGVPFLRNPSAVGAGKMAGGRTNGLPSRACDWSAPGNRKLPTGGRPCRTSLAGPAAMIRPFSSRTSSSARAAARFRSWKTATMAVPGAGLAPDSGQHQRLMSQIEAGGGLVQQEASGFARTEGRGRQLAQRTGDVHALALAARKMHVEPAGRWRSPTASRASSAALLACAGAAPNPGTLTPSIATSSTVKGKASTLACGTTARCRASPAAEKDFEVAGIEPHACLMSA